MSYRHPRYHNKQTLAEELQSIAIALAILLSPLALLMVAGTVQMVIQETSRPLIYDPS